MSAVLNLDHVSLFLRRTNLHPYEYNRRFKMIDEDILTVVTSAEADKVTPLMTKIYMRLVQAPGQYFKRERELYFEGEEREGKWVTAWKQLCQHLRVSSETARKALMWMHEQGIIGYSAFKNGVGIRIFLNRAASSIGVRPGFNNEKILQFSPALPNEPPASLSEAPYKDIKNNLDKEYKSGAPEEPGADTKPVDEPPSTQIQLITQDTSVAQGVGREVEPVASDISGPEIEKIVERLKCELMPCVKSAAAQAAAEAAAQATAREVARTREWFETKALPKAIRVAQHETYDLLRKQGCTDERERRARADLEVGRAAMEYTPPRARQLAPEEIDETAQMCVALLEAQGKSVDATISELSSERGGWLLPEDEPSVREAVEKLLLSKSKVELSHVVCLSS